VAPAWLEQHKQCKGLFVGLFYFGVFFLLEKVFFWSFFLKLKTGLFLGPFLDFRSFIKFWHTAITNS